MLNQVLKASYELVFLSSMSLGDRDYQSVFSYLRSLHFHFLEEWVVQCVNYCVSKNSDFSLDAIKSVVKEQWLLLNLRIIKVPSLPPNLASCNKTVLPGMYVVQVESMIDSSKSMYSQLQKMQKVNVENIETTKELKEWDIKSRRCLVFEISDGVQELKAMEYKPINKIRENDPELLPGFKMLITGPVECRKGMILLREENVKVYGGEVDTLTATHNLKSILIRKLNLNEEDFPSTLSNNEVDNQLMNEIKIENIIAEEPVGTTVSQNIAETLLSQNDDFFLSLPLEHEILAHQTYLDSSITPSTSYSVNEPKTVHENEIQLNQCQTNFNFNNLSRDNMFNNIFETRFKKHDLPQEDKTTPSPKKMSYSSEVESNTALMETTESQNFLPENEEEHHENKNFFNFNHKLLLAKEPCQTELPVFLKNYKSKNFTSNLEPQVLDTTKKAKLSVKISDRPFIYLKQILSSKFESPCIHTIKAIILTLKTKIAVENDEFKLRVTITDGSQTVDAEFCSSILENLLEYSPCEIQTMIKAKSLNSAMNSRIKEAFKKMQEKFISLNCLMKIKFFTDEKLPLILSLEELTTDHLNALKKRTDVCI